MKQGNIHLINKIFNNETIRIVWDKDEEKYYISVVDMVGVLVDSKEPRKYWNWLKNKLLKEENFETSSITRHLKLKATDGKYRITDVCDIEGMLRIIQSIPSKNAEPVKQWLAHLGKGLTDIWQDGGIEKEVEYAILTNEIYKSWSGMKANEYKQFKGIRKESLRDNMTDIEILLTDLGEIATRDIAKSEQPQGLKENMGVAKKGGQVANDARKSYEKATNKSAISNQNALNYQYIDEKNKFHIG